MRKVALRGIFEHKGRLIATFLAVALGVAFMSGVLVLADTMNSTFDDLFGDIYKDTDAVVRSQTEIGAGGSDAFGGADTRAQVAADLLDKVRDTDGVAQAEGNVQGFAQIIDKDGEPVGDPSMGPPTFGANWTDSSELNAFRIADGRAPEADDEIVIDKASADSTGYKPGDTVPVSARDGVADYKLVGIARFGTADSPAGASFVLWTTPAAQKLVGEEGRFQDIVVVADDGLSEDDVVASLKDSLKDDNVEVLTGTQITEETQSDIAQSLSFITRIFLVFAIIALVVGGFVIYNSFAIIVAQRTREMALLRAVGASGRQVRVAVLLEAAVVGITGAAVGIVLGLGLATIFSAFLQLPDNSLAIKPGSVLLALFTGVIVTVVSAYLPARRASRVPPLAAMREVAVDESGRSRVRLIAGVVVAASGRGAGDRGRPRLAAPAGGHRRGPGLRQRPAARAGPGASGQQGARRPAAAVRCHRGAGPAERRPQPQAHVGHGPGPHDRRGRRGVLPGHQRLDPGVDRRGARPGLRRRLRGQLG